MTPVRCQTCEQVFTVDDAVAQWLRCDKNGVSVCGATPACGAQPNSVYLVRDTGVGADGVAFETWY